MGVDVRGYNPKAPTRQTNSSLVEPTQLSEPVLQPTNVQWNILRLPDSLLAYLALQLKERPIPQQCKNFAKWVKVRRSPAATAPLMISITAV